MYAKGNLHEILWSERKQFVIIYINIGDGVNNGKIVSCYYKNIKRFTFS